MGLNVQMFRILLVLLSSVLSACVTAFAGPISFVGIAVPFLIKGSPAIAIIGLVDLTRVTNRIAAVTYDALYPILGAGLIYMLMIAVLVKVQARAERQARRLAM